MGDEGIWTNLTLPKQVMNVKVCVDFMMLLRLFYKERGRGSCTCYLKDCVCYARYETGF